MKTCQIGLAIALCLTAVFAVAQDFNGKTVGAVRFEGLERVSDQVLVGKIETKADTPFNQSTVSRDVRHLYELGYFNTVNAAVADDGGKAVVTFTVQEKRVIEEVRIIGNKKIKDKAIRAALKMREGDSFVPESYEAERKALLDLYEAKGYANSTVDASVENIGPSRVRLIYTINEGRKAKIRSIKFVGNDALTAGKLRKTMKTKKAWWFFGGKYEEAKFDADLTNIVNEYGNVGRLEAQVPKTDLVYTDDGKGMNVTIYLEEGPGYKMETLDIAKNQVFDNDEVIKQVKVKPGDVHNKGQVAKDVAQVQKTYQDSGYVDANVAPQVTLNRDTKTTRVVYNISEGDLKYMREIRVTGNNVTKDEIVRRQMLLVPGERYDGTAVEKSKQRLDNTHFFESVRVTLEEPKEAADLFTDMNVDVQEGKTGTFNFGGGYSTEDGIGVFSELRLNNFDIGNWPKFSGGGQQLRLKVNTGTRRDQYSLSFTEPEFLGYPVSMGFDVFDESYQVRGGAQYTESTSGGQLRFGKALSPYVTVQSGLLFQNTDISDLPNKFFLNHELREQLGSSTTLALRNSIERNTLDNKFDASKGSVHILSLETAGVFGGDNKFWKFEQDSTWYKGLGEEKKWILSLRARNGFMDSFGSREVPLQDRFYAGGTNTVRGYDNRDIGPKVHKYWFWGDMFSIGGNMRMIYNLEAKFKVTQNLRLYGFADAGGVWEDISDFDLGGVRYSVGLGLGFNVPMLGPIRVDYGFPLNPDGDQSSSGKLHLATGYRF